jgi:hypothetical protein
MRGTPRTAVRRTVPVLRPQWVTFLWSRTGPPLTAARRAHLDGRWAEFELSGGIVLHPVSILPDSVIHDDVVCTDEQLTTNVLCRNRNGLLHSTFELTELYFDAGDQGWCTDDPRLVDLVIERTPA